MNNQLGSSLKPNKSHALISLAPALVAIPLFIVGVILGALAAEFRGERRNFGHGRSPPRTRLVWHRDGCHRGNCRRVFAKAERIEPGCLKEYNGCFDCCRRFQNAPF
jgi:hypothetical protein